MSVQQTNENNECDEDIVENTFFVEESSFDLFKTDVCTAPSNVNKSSMFGSPKETENSTSKKEVRQNSDTLQQHYNDSLLSTEFVDRKPEIQTDTPLNVNNIEKNIVEKKVDMLGISLVNASLLIKTLTKRKKKKSFNPFELLMTTDEPEKTPLCFEEELKLMLESKQFCDLEFINFELPKQNCTIESLHVHTPLKTQKPSIENSEILEGNVNRENVVECKAEEDDGLSNLIMAFTPPQSPLEMQLLTNSVSKNLMDQFDEIDKNNDNMCEANSDNAKKNTTNHPSTGEILDTKSNATQSTSSSDGRPTQSIPMFTGFQTGSGKPVKFSNDKLMQAHKFLFAEEINISSTAETKSSNDQIIPMYTGFQTGSGKPVEISNDKLKQAKRFLFDEENILSSSFENKSSNNVGTSKLSGFQTGSGKPVQISKDKLEKARKILFDDEDISSSSVDGKSTDTKTPMFAGFQTGSGKSVKISDDRLKQARKFLFEEENILSSGNKSSNNAGTSVFSGFQTGSGKAVKISNDKLKQASKFLFDEEDKLSSTVENKSSNNSSTSMFSGFQTGSGKSVKISNDKLKQAHRFLFDEENILSSSSDNKSSNNAGTSKFSGFQTGSGKAVKISNDKLKLASKFLFDDESLTTETKSSNEQNIPKYTGFRTGSGKSVQISKEKLNQASKFLFDDDDTLNSSTENTMNTSKQPFTGFSTASGKNVGMPNKDKLDAASKFLFGDEENTTAFEPGFSNAKTSSSKGFGGFQTGSGKAVHISKSKLERAKALLDDALFGEIQSSSVVGSSKELSKRKRNKPEPMFLDDKTEIASGSSNDMPVGFSTGSGKKVTISKEKLEKYKNFFAEEFEELDQLSAQNDSGKEIKNPISGVQKSIQPPEDAALKNKKRKDHDHDNNIPETPSKKMKLKETPTKTPFKTPYKKTNSNVFKTPDMKRMFSTPVANMRRARPKKFVSPRPFIAQSPKPPNTPNEISVKRKLESPTATPIKRIKSVSPITPLPWLPVRQYEKQRNKRVPLSKFHPEEYKSVRNPEKLRSLGLKEKTLWMNSTLAKTFKFDSSYPVSQEFIDLLKKVKPNSTLDGNEELEIGHEDMRKILIHLGAAEHVVTKEWVANHYRLIVWTHAAMERSFPIQFGGKLLTPEQVLSKLIFRYDREYCNGKRSPIKRITERDDSAARNMVLCVSSVNVKNNYEEPQENDSQKPVYIELTDGWYCINAKIDPVLQRCLTARKLYEGMKLRICGANIEGSEQGCSPLELTSSTYLLLAGNFVRPAKWSTPLGFSRKPYFKVNINSIAIDGGKIPMIEVMVVKQYPMLFLEKIENQKSIIRSKRAEEHVKNKTAEKIMRKAQELREKILKEKRNSHKNRSRFSTPIQRVTDGKELYEMMLESTTPDSFCSKLSSKQQKALYEYQQKHQQEHLFEIQQQVERKIKEDPTLTRNTTPFIKVKLRDCCPYSVRGKKIEESRRECILTVWNINPDILDVLSEGNIVRISKTVPSNFGSGQILALNASRGTQYELVKLAKDVPKEHKESLNWHPRKVTPVKELNNFKMLDEFDAVGKVLRIDAPERYNEDYGVQNFFVVDDSDSILVIRLRESQTRIAMWDHVKEDKIFCFTNLSFSNYDPKFDIYVCHANEASEASEKPLPFMRERLQQLSEYFSKNATKLEQISGRLESILVPVSPVSEEKQKHIEKKVEPVITEMCCNLKISENCSAHFSIGSKKFSLPWTTSNDTYFICFPNSEKKKDEKSKLDTKSNSNPLDLQLDVVGDIGNQREQFSFNGEKLKKMISGWKPQQWLNKLLDQNEEENKEKLCKMLSKLRKQRLNKLSPTDAVFSILTNSCVLPSSFCKTINNKEFTDEMQLEKYLLETLELNNSVKLLWFSEAEWTSLMKDLQESLCKPFLKIWVKGKNNNDYKIVHDVECEDHDFTIEEMLEMQQMSQIQI